jgi:hypothetical protein
MHVYVYGSVCRGDVKPGSDVDLLAIVDGPDPRFDQSVYSVYPYSQLKDLWAEGNPFAWHLALESRMVYADDGANFIFELGRPGRYANWKADSEKFYQLFVEAAGVLAVRRDTTVFELAAVFLAVRNLAICYSLHVSDSPDFSRRSFERLGPDSLRLDARSSGILENARILSTRGFGAAPSEEDVGHVLTRMSDIDRWMCTLMTGA